MASCFAFLPHVGVQTGSEIRVGPFILWRNSVDEWVKRFRVDNTPFFEMYRDRRGEAVREKASILSRPDYKEASYEEFRDAVYCLSSTVWMRDSIASDAWVFEQWIVPVPTPRDEMYRRASRFSVHDTQGKYDRVYPTPYTYQINLSPNDEVAIEPFAQELSKPREESMLTAFGHFHLARFDTPYFTSHGDAVEAMWSGFESLLEIDRFGPEPSALSGGRCAKLLRLVRTLLGRDDGAIRVGKDEKLQRALHAEFSRHATGRWRQELWDGITAWTKQFYLERNHHSHGVRSDLLAKTVEPYDLSAFEIALHLARAVLRLRWLGGNTFFEAKISEEMNSLFLLVPVTKSVIDTLRHHDRKVWYPGTAAETANLTAEQLDRFHVDMACLVSLHSESRRFQDDGQVAQARKKMGLVLSRWVEDLLKQPPANVDLGVVSEVPNSIAAWAADKEKNDEEIDTELALALLDWGAADIEPYGAGGKGEPRLLLRDKIPIWLWVGAYIKLTELWLGHQLR